MNDLLPPEYMIRRPTMEDLAAVTHLVRLYDLQQDGETTFTENDMGEEWEKPRFRLDEDAWVICAPGEDGAPLVVGYQEVWNRKDHAFLQGDGYVHPDFNGRGIGTTLLRLAEARAREHIPLAPEEARVYIRNGVSGSDPAARELHENEGYVPVRYFWKMQVELKEAPPEPEWPHGIRLQPFRAGQDERRVFDAMEEAFRDHWWHIPWDYDWWCRRWFDDDTFAPGLWFIAVDGEEIAGGALCTYREQTGWVATLGVRRPWRRMGLGLALLRMAFGAFYQRGTRTVALGVDAGNPTGATRLYQKAGMQVAVENVLYEKELRPGVELVAAGES